MTDSFAPISQAPELEDKPVIDAPPVQITEDSPQVAPNDEPRNVSEGEEDEVARPTPVKQNTLLDSSYANPVKEGLNQNNEVVYLPSSTRETVAASIAEIPNVSIADNREGREWVEAVNQGMVMLPFDEVQQEALQRAEGQFRQAVEFQGAKMAGGYPRFTATSNETLKGERAAIRLMSHLGLGSIFQVPLWHTGIWVTIKAPTDGELLELQRRILDNKITLGRQSYGLVHSNTASYIVDIVASFVLEHVYDSTLKTTDDLKTIIATQDHMALAWGLACSIYTRGFHFQRACTTDPMKCTHVSTELLNLSKLLWVDEKALTEHQRAHMSKRRSNSMSMEEVKRYQAEMLRTQKRTISVGSKDHEIQLVLKTPSLADFIDSGHRWVDSISSMVNMALGMDGTSEERDNYITKHGKATSLRQYAHWIESIEFAGSSIEDQESIEDNLNLITSSDAVRDDILVKVSEYIRDTTIALVGIPAFDCPACGTEQKSDPVYPRHTNVIALDPYRLFFTLLMQRLAKIEVR